MELSPVFPIQISALVPLHRIASLIWLCGIVCLWLTRYTHQLGQRWGRCYYLLSACLRPGGIFLIGLGWFALYAPDGYHAQNNHAQYTLDWLPRHNWVDILCWLAIGAFFALGVWSMLVLGLRRSILFRRLEDSLVTKGPYALVRHPQFLSVIGITFFMIRLFDPRILDLWNEGGLLDANWALFTVSLWALSWIEERELNAHFGEIYREYARRVPRLFPV